jgi:hypothetical protein
MIDFMQSPEGSDEDSVDTPQSSFSHQPQQQLMMLSAAAIDSSIMATKTMQLRVSIQGHEFLFLVDSGSSSCFINQTNCASFS